MLLSDVKEERSDFVLENAYGKLGETLHQRSMILTKILSLPKPSNPKELEQLKRMNLQYKRLISTFEEAINQLNKYIKSRNIE